MATKNHGKVSVFKLNGVDLSSYLTKDGLDRIGEALDATAKGDNSKEYAPGLKDAKTDLEGLFDPTAHAAIQPLVNTKTTFEYGPLGTGAGSPKTTGNVIVTDYACESPLGLQTFKVSLQMTGDMTEGTY